jgi:hypothetical protein
MTNTADVTGGKPIAVLLQCISGVSAINPLVANNTKYKETYRIQNSMIIIVHQPRVVSGTK